MLDDRSTAADPARPSPLDLARRPRATPPPPPRRRTGRPSAPTRPAPPGQPSPGSGTGGTVDLRTLLDSSCGGDLAWLLDQIGLDVAASIDDWAARAGDDVLTLLAEDTDPGRVVDIWRARLRERSDLCLVELLVFERWMSEQCAALAPTLSTLRFDKTLHVCRLKIGTALYDHAKDINWRRPFVFARVLRLARDYFRAGLAAPHLINEKSLKHYEGKLGVATVLMSRFEECADTDLSEAIEQLTRSMDHGNPPGNAMPYVIEAVLRRHDLSGDRTLLIDGVRHVRSLADTERTVSCHLVTAELWLRLAAAAETSTASRKFVHEARNALAECENSPGGDLVDSLKLAVLKAIADTASSAGGSSWLSSLRGFSIPFGVAAHVEGLAGDSGPGDLARPIISTLREARLTRKGEPLFRRVLSELLAALAATSDLPVEEKIALLAESEEVRRGQWQDSFLTDEPSRIRTGTTSLMLAALGGQERHRVAGMIALLDESIGSDSSCYPLVLLGRDIEDHGRPSPTVLLELTRRFGSRAMTAPWLAAIDQGDPLPLYRAAAVRALGSTDLRRRHLGGRSGVWTTEDYLGLSNETFAFKRTPEACQRRDHSRTVALRDHLYSTGASRKFGIIEHITEVPSAGSPATEPSTLLTARRFERGEILADVCLTHPDRAPEVLGSAAEYLGMIHALEVDGPDPVSGRKNIKKAELGRWLKVVLPDGRHLSEFDAWWALVSSLPALPRRDAHPYNWIITADERILAVDLEAAGHRPIGYELSQLTDDIPLLPLSKPGWAVRETIVARYCEALQRGGSTASADEASRGYRAGLVARAVRSLTDPGGDPALRRHGEAVLAWFAEREPDTQLRAWAARVRRKWSLRLGAPAVGEPETTDARRRHVSRALAYHLRHDLDCGMDNNGWAESSRLAALLGASGLAASEAEVLAVAGALHESRFDISGTKVRARYGHSVEVRVDYPTPPSRPELFHATSVDSVNAIFSEAQGLLPMTRQWVHLSSEWKAAMRTGGRKVGPILLQLPAHDAVDEFRYAGGTTWLAPTVPSTHLQAVPIYRLFCWTERGR